MKKTLWSLITLSTLAFTATPVQATPIQLITNGGFETGTFTGWTVTNQANGSGNWFIQTGTGSPLNSFVVPAPPGGTFAAMTDQGGPGSHALIQSFVVPTGVTQATLSFDVFVNNQAGAFFNPNTLDFTSGANQQARVDILAPGATPFSLAVADVLLNAFTATANGGYLNVSVDVTSLLQAYAGQTLQLRFAEVDNQLFFNFGVDNVSLLATVPEPATLAVFGLMAAGGLGYVRRRTKAVAAPTA